MASQKIALGSVWEAETLSTPRRPGGLPQKAFSPNNPTLKFNDLSNQSDRDEQKGFMMLFSGAVSGLRNPRAHGFIQDDPERALEFIAFVSLLAKLLDEAKGPLPKA
jgi:uncharacterized protein (TIGR02391 family)